MLETAAMTQRLAVKLQLMEASQHAESERSAALERHYQYMQVWGLAASFFSAGFEHFNNVGPKGNLPVCLGLI